MASPPQVGASGTCTIPADLLPDAKVGATYTVKSMDGDNVVLESSSAGAGSPDTWNDDAVTAMKGADSNV